MLSSLRPLTFVSRCLYYYYEERSRMVLYRPCPLYYTFGGGFMNTLHVGDIILRDNERFYVEELTDDGIILEWYDFTFDLNSATPCRKEVPWSQLGSCAIVQSTTPRKAPAVSDDNTPRPPRAEWFGVGPGRWPHWWLKFGRPDSERGANPPIWQGCYVRVLANGLVLLHRTPGIYTRMDHVELCLPVLPGTEFPVSAGWKVVGERK